MKILLLSVGSRGDMEPFLAQAHLLRDKGHQILCAFPEQFREMTQTDGFDFYSLGPEFLELIEGEHTKTIMSGSGSRWHRLKALWKVIKLSQGIIGKLIKKQKAVLQDFEPDRILFHPKCTFGIIWELYRPGTTCMLSPLPCILHPVDRFTTIGIRGVKDWGPFWNRQTYRITNFIRIVSLQIYARKHVRDLKGLRLRFSSLWRLTLHEGKSIYTFSPTLFPPPENWSDNIQVVGYYERDKTTHWSPSEALERFIEKHEKIVFISFGSMVNNKPKEKTESILEVLKKHQIPAIINTSWGGLEKPESIPDHVLFVNNIPYDWLFSKVFAVVHHGGSGTTHTGIKYACPTLIIPHIVDQFLWNKVIHQAGLGPLGVPIEKLTAGVFEEKLLDLVSNKTYEKQALSFSQQMASENKPEELTTFICN